MKIKSAKYFRERYMVEKRHIQHGNGYSPDFIGCIHQTEKGEFIKGFFDMCHGDKQDIGGYLSSYLKIAEDGQAIYEFMQNAADCNSTNFYIFYNDSFFLAVNNGSEFTQEGLRSLLNVGQSDKKSASLIGRFGIGFKLVHRLVGKGDGMKELISENKGPILFSWSRKEDLISLINKDEIETVQDIEDSSTLPYFLKLILTNFPTDPNERVKDLNYNDTILFTDEEYAEMSSQVKEWLMKYLDDDVFNQGSLFFIKLGNGKKELLDKDYSQNLKVGVEYSLNTLKRLKNVKINDVQINEVTLQLENGLIKKDSDDFIRISPEYDDSDIHFSIGYNEIDFESEKPFLAVEELKRSPTFYKYFPLGDEIHQSAIFIHCDSLSNEANRRKLHEDHINKELIPMIAKFIVERMKFYDANKMADKFKQLYANLLLSESPHDNSDWLKPAYYDIVQFFLTSFVPTDTSETTNVQNVKIRKIACNVPLKLANKDYKWFAWGPKENIKPLIDAAKEKLLIKDYDIVDFVIETDCTILDNWISSASNEDYCSFLTELNASARLLSNVKVKEKIKSIKLLKFSDGYFYSYNEIVGNRTVYKNYKKVVEYFYKKHNDKPFAYLYNKVMPIRSILESMGFVMSVINVDNYENIKQCISLPSDVHFFGLISDGVRQTELSLEEKKRLFAHLTSKDANAKLDGVGDESIKGLYLCKTEGGISQPLSDMLSRKISYPAWFSTFMVSEDDYFAELDKYLLQEKDVYGKIIYPNWETIIAGINCDCDISDFYNKVQTYYNLDAANNKPLAGKAYVYTQEWAFVKEDEIVFNSHMLNEQVCYVSLNNVLQTVFGMNVPLKKVASIFSKAPFSLPASRITDLSPLDKGVLAEDLDTIIKVCTLNNEQFFANFVINEKDGEFYVESKTDNYYQVYTKYSNVRHFIEKYCNTEMVILPSELESHKEDLGVIRGESMYNKILACLDNIEAHKEELVDILKYDSRKDFINSLSSFTISLDNTYAKESYEYKILEMACNVLEKEDCVEFRSKTEIIKDGISYTYDQIPSTLSDKIDIPGGKKSFDLAMLLPNENGNGALLDELIRNFTLLGMNHEKLNNLFGVSTETKLDEIYEAITSKYGTLKNAQQLAFVLLMCDNNKKEKPDFQLFNSDNLPQYGNFVIKSFSFIDKDYSLADVYSDLSDYVKLPYGDNKYIQEPYIDEGSSSFICPGLNTKKENIDIDYALVIDLLNFLMPLKKKNETVFKNVNWSTIKDELGFDPIKCIYPSQYATAEETLPIVIEEWAKLSKENILLLSSMGVKASDDIEINFRKFMTGEADSFDMHTIYSSKSLYHLEQSLAWLSEKQIFPLNKEKYDTCMIAVEQINKLRGNRAGIVISDEFDLETLSDNSIQCSYEGYKEWKEETGFSIYIFEGKLPHVVSLDEYIDNQIYTYNDSLICTDDNNKFIYVSSEADLHDALHQLAKDNNINLSAEDVYKLFDGDVAGLRQQLEKLKEENDLLRHNLPTSYDDARMRGHNPNDVDTDERPEYNEVARKKVMKKLKAEGYTFNAGFGDCSIVAGVQDPEGNPVPLVVKSCKWGTLFINPIEWGTLLYPNAMLWVFDGSDVYPLHLRPLIMNQEKLVLSMDTRNLDDVAKVSKFAQILRYFKQIHFEFDSVRPTTIATTFKQYAFDDRPMDEKPEEDEFPA